MNDCKSEEDADVDEVKSRLSVNNKSRYGVWDTKTDLTTSENPQGTIERMLAGYDIGTKLKRLRLRKKIGLVDLGKHTGLSASMLSQLENGKLVPTLPTLSRIAIVFDVGLEFFFDYKRPKRVFSITRAQDRLRFPERPDNPAPAFFFEVLAYGAMEKRVAAYLAEFPVRGVSEIREHYHEGFELVHVFAGVLVVRYESEDHILEAGDTVYFDALEPHSYQGQSDPAARAMVITTQPQI